MRKKVLIVDDDESLVEVLQKRLEVSGYDTVTAYEGIRAVQMAHREKPDLILLDWMIPTGHGGTVLESLGSKNDTRRIPVIIITGVYEKLKESENELPKVVQAVLRKPIDTKVLLKKMREVLEWKEIEESIEESMV